MTDKKKGLIVSPERAVELFTGNKIDYILHEIEQEVIDFVPDLSTTTGRKEIASLARKVSKSKVVLDKAGKELTASWKSQSKIVDASRREARDFLDGLRDRIRKPLTEWEDAKKAEEELADLNEEIAKAYEEAILLDGIVDRERDLAEREEEILLAQAAERQRITDEQDRIARIAREKKIKEDAIIAGRLLAEKEAEDTLLEAKRAEAKARQEREAMRLQAIQIAEDAENERIEYARIAEHEKIESARLAEISKMEAIREAEEARIIAEIEAARVEKAKADNVEHQRKINREALASLVAKGIDKTIARKIVELVITNKVAHISIKY